MISGGGIRGLVRRYSRAGSNASKRVFARRSIGKQVRSTASSATAVAAQNAKWAVGQVRGFKGEKGRMKMGTSGTTKRAPRVPREPAQPHCAHVSLRRALLLGNSLTGPSCHIWRSLLLGGAVKRPGCYKRRTGGGRMRRERGHGTRHA